MGFRLGYPGGVTGVTNGLVQSGGTTSQGMRVTITGDYYIPSSAVLADTGFLLVATPVEKTLYDSTIGNLAESTLAVADFGWCVSYNPSDAPIFVEGLSYGIGGATDQGISSGNSGATFSTFGELREVGKYYRLIGWKEITLWDEVAHENPTNGNVYGMSLFEISGIGGDIVKTLISGYVWQSAGKANRQEIGACIPHFVYDNGAPYSSSLNTGVITSSAKSISQSDLTFFNPYPTNPNPVDAMTDAVLSLSPNVFFEFSEQHGQKAWDMVTNTELGTFQCTFGGGYGFTPLGVESMGLPGKYPGITNIGGLVANDGNNYLCSLTSFAPSGTTLSILVDVWSPDQWATNTPRFCSTGQTDTDHSGWELGVIQAGGSTPGGIAMIIGDGTTTAEVGVATAPSTTSRHLVGTTYDGAELVLYIDGVAVSSVATSLVINGGTNPVRFLTASGFGGGNLYGSLGYCAIWDSVALSASDMLDLYNTWESL